MNPVPCTGCLNCQVVCGQAEAGFHDPDASAIRVVLDPFQGAHVHVTCRQCETPGCVPACPSGAISRDQETGAWTISRELCTRCRECLSACPFGAMFWRDDLDIPLKCHLCRGKPRCVSACVFGALRYLSPSDALFGFRGIPGDEQDPDLGRGGP